MGHHVNGFPELDLATTEVMPGLDADTVTEDAQVNVCGKNDCETEVNVLYPWRKSSSTSKVSSTCVVEDSGGGGETVENNINNNALNGDCLYPWRKPGRQLAAGTTSNIPQSSNEPAAAALESLEQTLTTVPPQ
jgi:hypothetical protein